MSPPARRGATPGAEVYLWRPSDLDEITRVLSKPWRYSPHALSLGEEEWTPESLWPQPPTGA